MGTGVHEQLLRQKDRLRPQVSVDTEKLDLVLPHQNFQKKPEVKLSV